MLMRKSPEILAVCTWLETPLGHRLACTAVSMAPVSALALTSSGSDSVMAIKFISGGIVALCFVMSAGFTVCGRSLLRAIDESLLLQQQQEESRERGQRMSVSGGREHSNTAQSEKRYCNGGDPFLRKARRKVKIVVVVANFLCVNVAVILAFAVCTNYGSEAPLLVFVIPMAYMPPMWNVAHIQLHSGRTKLSRSGSISLRPPRPRERPSLTITVEVPGVMGAHLGNQHRHQVVPTEMHSISPC